MSNGELVSIAIGTAIGSTIGMGVPLGLMWLRKRRWEREFRARVERELPLPLSSFNEAAAAALKHPDPAIRAAAEEWLRGK